MQLQKDFNQFWVRFGLGSAELYQSSAEFGSSVRFGRTLVKFGSVRPNFKFWVRSITARESSGTQIKQSIFYKDLMFDKM